MEKLNTNIIYDSSPVTERLIKFSMFYFDEVNLHFPEICALTVKGLPKKLSEVKDFIELENRFSMVTDIFSFYNKADLEKFNKLALTSNLNISNFINGGLILDYITMLSCVPDNQGRLVYKKGMTKYENGDYPLERLAKLNKSKKNSPIMQIISKSISSNIFNDSIKKTNDGFEIEADETGNVDINNNSKKIFENAYNDNIVEYLYQYNGEYIYDYDYLKKYEWFKEYYYTILNYIFNILSSTENIIITDNVLADILRESNSLNGFKSQEQFASANKISQVLLPDFFDLDYEDIYELKEYANDELIALKYYMNSLGKIESQEELEQIIQTKINPSVNELNNKIINMKINLTQKAIREIKNPISYLPLLSSLVTDIDQTLAAAISLGVMGADLALEYYKEKQNIKNHPLFFTVKLNKKINKLR